MADATATVPETSTGLVRGLGLLDSTMLVAGSMIGSGIFIVSSGDCPPGRLARLAAGGLDRGRRADDHRRSLQELAAMMPRAGGQYVSCVSVLAAVGLPAAGPSSW